MLSTLEKGVRRLGLLEVNGKQIGGSGGGGGPGGGIIAVSEKTQTSL